MADLSEVPSDVNPKTLVIRSALRRLEILERQAPQNTDKWHTTLVSSDEEEEQETAALKASPKWTEGDNLIVIRLVGVERAEVPQ